MFFRVALVAKWQCLIILLITFLDNKPKGSYSWSVYLAPLYYKMMAKEAGP